MWTKAVVINQLVVYLFSYIIFIIQKKISRLKIIYYNYYCYILVVPAFGIISHTISINSGRAVFGYFIKIMSTLYLSSPFVFIFRYVQTATYYMQERCIILYSTLILLIEKFFPRPYFLSNDLKSWMNQNYNVIICVKAYYSQVTKALSTWVETSETIRMLSTNPCNGNDDYKIRQWIAGLVDGDGNLHISKKGYVELSVVMEPRD